MEHRPDRQPADDDPAAWLAAAGTGVAGPTHRVRRLPAPRPDSRLRACSCTLGGRRAEPDCPSCAGAGRSPSALSCDTCRDTRRIEQGVNVTITDLESRVVHLTWPPGDPIPAPLVATQPGGKPVHQLPETYRLATWAGLFGVRPEDLTELDGGGLLDHCLRDGVVTLDHAGADALTWYLRQASRGRPGARLLVGARRPDVPALADLVRVVLGLGLGLAVTVTVVDHRHNAGDLRLVQGESWDVTVGLPGLPVAPADPPTRCTRRPRSRSASNTSNWRSLAPCPTMPPSRSRFRRPSGRSRSTIPSRCSANSDDTIRASPWPCTTTASTATPPTGS
ncbi:hypothetical protein ACFP2T_12590 [Plantactinospora solaniradicis]|uniref:Uncharacterized protein n=1 Tax=Plantactinospora solaniradicis TaxID=1723736 RepID=A0ABW1K5J0_9ACTN